MIKLGKHVENLMFLPIVMLIKLWREFPIGLKVAISMEVLEQVQFGGLRVLRPWGVDEDTAHTSINFGI